jgi:hypothetical protein
MFHLFLVGTDTQLTRIISILQVAIPGGVEHQLAFGTRRRSWNRGCFRYVGSNTAPNAYYSTWRSRRPIYALVGRHRLSSVEDTAQSARWTVLSEVEEGDVDMWVYDFAFPGGE